MGTITEGAALSFPAKRLSTGALIAELKDRGFAVVERAAIRRIGARARMDKDSLLRTEDMRSAVRRELAIGLAAELHKQPEFLVRENGIGVTYVEFETTLTFLGASINPDDAEYPIYLSMERDR